MKIKSAKKFELVDVNKETIREYCEKYKGKGKLDEAKQLEVILKTLDGAETVSDKIIEDIVNAAFDANRREMKSLRKEIRKLPVGDDSRKTLREKIKYLSKANRALIPFSKRQRLVLLAASNHALH